MGSGAEHSPAQVHSHSRGVSASEGQDAVWESLPSVTSCSVCPQVPRNWCGWTGKAHGDLPEDTCHNCAVPVKVWQALSLPSLGCGLCWAVSIYTQLLIQQLMWKGLGELHSQDRLILLTPLGSFPLSSPVTAYITVGLRTQTWTSWSSLCSGPAVRKEVCLCSRAPV